MEYDGVTFKKPKNGLVPNVTYINVFSNKFSVFEIYATVTYTVEYDKKVNGAVALNNSMATYQNINNEYG